VLRAETIRVNIPPGAEPGKRIRLRGKGEAGVRGGAAGDLYIVPRIRPHPIVTRSGRDLSMELPITVGEALRGASVEVPTPVGSVNVKIPAGAQSGQRLRVRGKGVPAHGRESAGDLYLNLMVRVPKDEIAQDVIDKIDRAYGENVRKDLRLWEQFMARRYLRITEVIKICGVDEKFVDYLERERIVQPVIRRKLKVYAPEQVDRVRVARLLIEELGVNIEGAEVALHMREQMIAMQRQFNELLRLLGQQLKK
jgi:DnaJ-class molecular chaperone